MPMLPDMSKKKAKTKAPKKAPKKIVLRVRIIPLAAVPIPKPPK